ncbi:MAG: endonuclease/exonuclease/phosphatase family protein [Candidatus Sericytochromatia bacterium]|nr:endonuclease/exonuclease/phosphatase family protein [Candidatus Tanganyikabacteria bacterium]
MGEIPRVGSAPNAAARILGRALKPASQAGPGIPGDSLQLASPPPIRVITFNTAVGNSKIKTPQASFPDLPFYQEIINGHPDAPILAGQEIGTRQLDRLKALSKNGSFQVVATYAHPGQANMVLVPRRFEVLGYQHRTYGMSHLRGFWNGLKGWFTGKGTPHWSQMFEPRKYTELRLRDRESGREFTLFNTHTSYYGPLKVEQNTQLFAAARAAKARGPVIVAGDLNTRAADNARPDKYDSDARVLAQMGDFKDMGPPSKSQWPRPNIDWILADGFSPVTSRVHTGDSLSLPGSPNAELVSDHYAEEDTLRFD